MEYEYGGQEEDELKYSQKELSNFNQSILEVLESLRQVETDCNRKSEALKAQYVQVSDMVGKQTLSDSLRLDREGITRQMDGLLATGNLVEKFRGAIADFFGFYVQVGKNKSGLAG